MPRTKVKTPGANLPVPQDDDAAREAVRLIGEMRRQLMRLEADMNDGIAKLQESYGNTAAPLQEELDAAIEGLRIYAEANRERLTRGGKVKYHRFSTGEIAWRKRPQKVNLRKVEDVINAIKAAGLAKKFLRTKEEVNKDAMLDDPETAGAIKGVSIGSAGEDFIVEPGETELTADA